MSTKFCPHCKTDKLIENYYEAKERKDGLRAICKSCSTKTHRESYQRNNNDKTKWPSVAKRNIRAANIKKRYKLTEQEYDDLISQGCSICGGHHKMAIDHCHITGKVRGPLCHQCNIGLGAFKDNPDLLEKAKVYLKNGN